MLPCLQLVYEHWILTIVFLLLARPWALIRLSPTWRPSKQRERRRTVRRIVTEDGKIYAG